MVGIIVSRAVGEPLADYLSRKIWAPYGMESDASWLTDGGTEIGGCRLNVTPRAYGRLGQFMMEGGSAGGAGVVPEGWIGEATPSKSSPGATPTGNTWWTTSTGIYAVLGTLSKATRP